MNHEPRLRMLELQNEILEAVATGLSLSAVAEMLCLRAEAFAPAAICTILLVDPDRRLRPLAAPALPQHYSDALDGVPIGPLIGSCGTAAFLGEAVEVTDIGSDPHWADYRDLALPLGLAACWSSPIKARDGRVIATFAFYFRTRRGPTDLERLIVQTCVHLCAIAIEHAEMQDRAHQLAYYDQLTSLPNLRGFNELINREIRLAEPTFGLLLVDIDHLKTINDTMGHLVGDVVIKAVADRLRATGPDIAACRLGGDEFACLVILCPGYDALSAAADRILAAMTAPLQIDGNMIVPQVTLGGVVYGADGTDAKTLRQNADFALYHAKETNRGSYVRFDKVLRTTMTRRIETLREVEQALGDKRMIIYYQPLVKLDTAEIVGLEALARMRAPDGTIVSAQGFGVALSDPKLAYRLTDAMLAQVAGDMRNWIADGIPFHHVGINLSPADFRRGDLEQRISSAFRNAGVPLSHIVLEVTEAVFLDGAGRDIARMLKRLRKQGLLVALDDFGTGFASLSHLLTLPVDIIKIDRSFVDRILTDPASSAIVEALLDIARKLKMRVVAEGIENENQAERLSQLGCGLGQGYHFAAPVCTGTATRLLKSFARPVSAAKPFSRAAWPYLSAL